MEGPTCEVPSAATKTTKAKAKELSTVTENPNPETPKDDSANQKESCDSKQPTDGSENCPTDKSSSNESKDKTAAEVSGIGGIIITY